MAVLGSKRALQDEWALFPCGQSGTPHSRKSILIMPRDGYMCGSGTHGVCFSLAVEVTFAEDLIVTLETLDASPATAVTCFSDDGANNSGEHQ